MFTRNRRRNLFLVGAALLPTPVMAHQPVPAPTPAPTQPATTKPTTDPAVAPPPSEKVTGSKKVYVPADFARFAPRTGYDMPPSAQVPKLLTRKNVTELATAASPTRSGDIRDRASRPISTTRPIAR